MTIKVIWVPPEPTLLGPARCRQARPTRVGTGGTGRNCRLVGSCLATASASQPLRTSTPRANSCDLARPPGEGRGCYVDRMIQKMRLPDGRFQVQGRYRETADLRGFERI